jgi:sulfhydrogenase subunit alpha
MKDTQGRLARLEAALSEAGATLPWAALYLPEDNQVFINAALRHRDEYAIYGGRIVSDSKLGILHEQQ